MWPVGRHLRSDSVRRHYIVVPRHSLSSYGRRAFAVVGPTAWNSLSDDQRDLTLSTDSFRRLLKTVFRVLAHIQAIQRIRGIAFCALHKFAT